MVKVVEKVVQSFGRRKVELSDGTTVSWNTRSKCWLVKDPVRWNSKVATSLQHKAMTIADENGGPSRTAKSYFAFEPFAKELMRLCGHEALDVIKFLGGSRGQ